MRRIALDPARQAARRTKSPTGLGRITASQRGGAIRYRLAILVDDLAFKEHVTLHRDTGVRLAAWPRDRAIEDADVLVLTSGAFEVRGTALHALCSGPCGEMHSLEHMGLRVMGAGVVRNQPRCQACRRSDDGSRGWV